ncbi:hypothetical protein [Metabacillus sp. RGM 3146]
MTLSIIGYDPNQNFEEREQEDGKIDLKVLNYMKKQKGTKR